MLLLRAFLDGFCPGQEPVPLWVSWLWSSLCIHSHRITNAVWRSWLGGLCCYSLFKWGRGKASAQLSCIILEVDTGILIVLFKLSWLAIAVAAQGESSNSMRVAIAGHPRWRVVIHEEPSSIIKETAKSIPASQHPTMGIAIDMYYTCCLLDSCFSLCFLGIWSCLVIE